MTVMGRWSNKPKVATCNRIYYKYKDKIWKASNELYAQFLIRIYKEIPGSIIANFSTLTILTGENFETFRNIFKSQIEKLFIVPANSFDNVKGSFPIGFFIQNCLKEWDFCSIIWDIFNSKWEFIGNKHIIQRSHTDKSLNKRLKLFSEGEDTVIWLLSFYPSDYSNNERFSIINQQQARYCKKINKNNLLEMCIYVSVRMCIEHTRINHNDQFYHPNDNWEYDKEFQNDCIIFTIFHDKNKIVSHENDGVNHRIPFTEQQVEAREKFKSHFMTDFLKDKVRSPEAEKVYQAWLALWRYYHEACSKDQYLANASLYEIREYFQWRNEKGKMNVKSSDETYTELIENLRAELKNLASKIADKVYEYEFLKR